MYFILLLTVTKCIQLVPEYQSSSVTISSRPAGSKINPIVFSQAFTPAPQIVINLSYLDIDGGIIKYSTNLSSVTQNGFILTTFSTNYVSQIIVQWMAFLDDNIYSQCGSIVQNIVAQMFYINVTLQNPQIYIPNAVVFLNGVNQTQTTNSTSYECQILIKQRFQTQMQFQIQIVSGFAISSIDYNIICGSPQYLLAGWQWFGILGTVQLFPVDTRIKVSQVGLGEVWGWKGVRISIANSSGSVTFNTWSITNMAEVILSYFNYMPCPLYCTTCYTAAPNCDGCLASTFRVGSDCNNCLTQMYVQAGQINCQTCSLYCNQCSGIATHCLSCQAITQRINPPLCTTCPSQMFIQSGMNNCQQCSNYCNECQTLNYCLACNVSTLRLNPPNCMACPLQYYLVTNTLDCQPCMSYCNNCQNYSCQCIACSASSLRLNPPDCLDCPQNYYLNGNTCTQCNETCQTCDSSGCLSCLFNQYIDVVGSCVQCPSHCLTCDIHACQSCTNNCGNCNLTSCLSCSQDNYYLEGTNCYQCPENCLTCNAQQCLTCIGPRMPLFNECVCLWPCSTCDSNQCLTCISPQYRLSDLTCQFCPENCVACDEQGNCYIEQFNCQIGIYISNSSIQCTQCQSNYFLQDNFCIQCSDQCLECHGQPQNCTICRFQNIIPDCSLCESTPGLYSNYETNTCYSVCGDGIINESEECDDGNIVPKDGCTNCQIDTGYDCSGTVCEIIVYPNPMMTQNLTLDSAYNATKQFQLSYNVPIQQLNLHIELRISNFTSFNYTIMLIDDSNLNIIINLTQQLLDAQVQIIFMNINEIVYNSFHQQINMTQCPISNYIMLTSTEQDISNSNNTIINSLLIVFIAIICLAIIFGGLEIFWNLLDLLQTMSYLKYVNTIKPYYLQQFLNLFGFLQFQNLPSNQLFNIQDYLLNSINIDEFQKPPLLIKNDGYTTSTIINVIPILNVFLVAMCSYLFALITLTLIYQKSFSQRFSLLIKNIRVVIIMNKLNHFLINSCRNIITPFVWSGLIRIFISSTYDICFSICLGIYGIQFENFSYLLRFDQSITLIITFLFCLITFLISIIASFKYSTLELNANTYGAVCEGLKTNQELMKQNNILLLVKRMLFMIFLVLLYNEPLFQILNIILIQVAQIVFLIVMNPIADKKEKQKQFICEVFMLIAEIQLAILVIDDYWVLFIYENRSIFGWICVFALVILTLSQLIFDVHQQVQLYYKHYPTVRKYWQTVKNTLHGQPKKEINLEQIVL